MYSKKYFNSVTQKSKNNLLRYINQLKNLTISLENKTICDIGCAEGSLLELLHTKESVPQKKLYGVDISKYAIDMVKKKGFNGKVVNFDKVFNPIIKFDMAFALDVIEHMENPYVFLNNIKKILKKNGYVILTTPNISSFSHLIQKDNWYGYLDKTHKFLFEKEGLKYILKKNGFNIVKCETLSNTNNVIYNAVTELLKIASQLFFILQKP